MAEGSWYSQFTRKASQVCGRPAMFAFACLVILAWLATGPMLGFSDTWQLIINTFTTLVTFLMVFLIQNSQNRDTEAIQVKLDELIRATKNADNAMIDLEALDEERLHELHDHFEKLAIAARSKMKQETRSAGLPEAVAPSADRGSTR